MALHSLNFYGLKCPQPVLKLAVFGKTVQPGDTVEVLSDCESFPASVSGWCTKTGRTLLFCVDEGGGKFKAQIQF
jgi:tRNA 2-thiouridine synthesizing protein A